MPIRTEPKPCVCCGGIIPKNRMRYKTCTPECSEIRKKQSWKITSNGKPSDTEGPEVARVSKWLVKPW